MTLSNIGWFGSVLLGLCCLPQAYCSMADGHSRGVSWLFIILWLLGEVTTFIAVVGQHGPVYLLFNYLLNILAVSIIGWYKLYPTSTAESLEELVKKFNKHNKN